MKKAPIILAIDTSTEACSAALLQEQSCVLRFEKTANAHTKLLLPMITSILEETQCRLADIDALAVTRGPGSFTGVRIGVGMAQGLSFGLNIPVYEISTLAALAYTANIQGLVNVAIDARMHEVYVATFYCENNAITSLDAESLCSPDLLIERALHHQSASVALVGSGWDVYRDNIVLPPLWQHIPAQLPQAKAVALLAYQQWLQGQKGVFAQTIKPVYLRDQVAQKAKSVERL
ncbi:MAG: tRNA (adenosine(37)-N6)-threonylcarbamoyltransferase complex dimerization subunit type 1 TsaB [Candidatus Berkiella sp.]